MTITVIIPTLNEASTIAQTLQHTAELGFDRINVVDGGSTDGTTEIVRTLGAQGSTLNRIRLLTSPPGRAKQLNTGARASDRDILLFLHADTRLPDHAKQLIESALADPHIVGGRFDVRFDNTSPWSRIIAAFMNARSRFTRISTGDQAMFVRRNIFERLGGFSDIPLMEDIEFSSRLKPIGPIAPLRETVTTSFRRWEQQGPLRTILLMWTLRFLYWLGVSPERLSKFYAAIR